MLIFKAYIAERFSPYQLVVGTLTLMYALRNLDVLVGLGCEWIIVAGYSVRVLLNVDHIYLAIQPRNLWPGW
jgi:hypothetical protein